LASVSTGAAFAWWALGEPEAAQLRQEVIERTLGEGTEGFADGYLLDSGQSVGVATSQGNFLVLASLLYREQGALVKQFQPSERWQRRGWWLGG
ncbi:MAG: DUF3131 domain-containing protein, partial [Thermostichales cyanobacterium BF4_bins_65]